MAIPSAPMRQVLLLSGQTDKEIKGIEIEHAGGRHACTQAEASRTHPRLARDPATAAPGGAEETRVSALSGLEVLWGARTRESQSDGLGSLKVEHQAVTLSEYDVSLLDDHKQVQMVKSARRHETPFRSPQLTLFDLDEGGWLLYWKTPEPAPRPLRPRVEGVIQLPLFEPQPQELAAGAEEGSSARW